MNTQMDTPAGRLVATVRDGSLERLVFSDEPAEGGHDPIGVAAAVRAYLDGHLDALDAIPLRLDGTPFQHSVWRALRRIPPGSTATYAEIAAALGLPGAARAVGRACGANPVWIAVPCHRVIGADGSLRGYGGGLDRKRWLLAHEGTGVRA